MEKLVKQDADYLRALREVGDGKAHFSHRFREVDPQIAHEEAVRVNSLVRHGMIEQVGTMDSVNPGTRFEARFPSGFRLTSDGMAYHSEMRKQAALRVAGAVATAALGGFFAWLFLALLPV